MASEYNDPTIKDTLIENLCGRSIPSLMAAADLPEMPQECIDAIIRFDSPKDIINGEKIKKILAANIISKLVPGGEKILTLDKVLIEADYPKEWMDITYRVGEGNIRDSIIAGMFSGGIRFNINRWEFKRDAYYVIEGKKINAPMEFVSTIGYTHYNLLRLFGLYCEDDILQMGNASSLSSSSNIRTFRIITRNLMKKHVHKLLEMLSIDGIPLSYPIISGQFGEFISKMGFKEFVEYTDTLSTVVSSKKNYNDGRESEDIINNSAFQLADAVLERTNMFEDGNVDTEPLITFLSPEVKAE